MIQSPLTLHRLVRTVCLLWACVAAAHAADGMPDKLPACQTCHGRDGASAASDIPNLAGQKHAYLVKQLTAFKDGSRKSELMRNVAAQLNDTDIRALATYWSAQPAMPAAGSPPVVPPVVSRMAFPAGFPQGYTEYHRKDDAEKKLVKISYANAVALQAARAGQALPDGSVIMEASHAVLLDADGKPQLDDKGRMRFGKVVVYDGMESRAGWGEAVPELLRNGNWHYGLFTPEGNSRLGAAQPRCLACHKGQAQDGYLFGLGHLR